MPIYKIQAGRIITVESSTWVGPEGTIWYDEVLADLRIGDGVTPGGRLLQFGGAGGGVTIIGSVANSSLLNLSYTGASGDGFIAEDTGNLWVWNGTSWTTNPNSMATAREDLASAGTQASALAAGGYIGPAVSAATEEFTGPSTTLNYKTLTTS